MLINVPVLLFGSWQLLNTYKMANSKSDNQSNIIFVNPNNLSGLSITGQSNKTEYKGLITPLKNALLELDYVFSSIIQVYKKGSIENEFPTLAVAFDGTKIDSQEKYDAFFNKLIELVEPIFKQDNLKINLVVLDNKERFLKNFKQPTSWIIDIKDPISYKNSAIPWWKFW